MTEREYTKSECDTCKGTGVGYDSTSADKINAGPYKGQCAKCSGRGAIFTYIPTAEQAAYTEKTRAEARYQWDEPIGEIPDWML